MGFKDLFELRKKKNRVLLILIIWLLISFTLFELFDFPFTQTLGILIFVPLIVVCFILVFLVTLLRKDLKDISLKKVLLYLLIAIPVMLIFSFFFALLFSLFLVLFFLGLISYIFITAFFYIYNSYSYGVVIDNKFLDMSKAPRIFFRFTTFVGGIILALILIFVDLGIIQGTQPYLPINLFNFLDTLPRVILLTMGFLTLLALILLVTKRFHAWLGIFFFWVAIYSLYLSISAVSYALSGSPTPPTLTERILLYLFDIFLILFTLSQLIGDRADIISKKLPFRADTVIIWLIFSKASYEFVNVLPSVNIGEIRVVLSFLLFIPLFFFLGLYGLFKHSTRKHSRRKSR